MKNVPAFEMGEETPGFLLWQVSNQWQRAQREALAPLKLTHVQYVLLQGIIFLSKHKDMVSQNALAKATHTDVMMTSQVVRAMLEKKLLKRQDNPNDSRAFTLSITPKGRELVAEATKRIAKADEEFFAPLGRSAKTLSSSLQSLMPNQA